MYVLCSAQFNVHALRSYLHATAFIITQIIHELLPNFLGGILTFALTKFLVLFVVCIAFIITQIIHEHVLTFLEGNIILPLPI